MKTATTITWRNHPTYIVYRGYGRNYKYIGYNEHHTLDMVVYNIR